MRGAVFMNLSMASFTLNDTCMKAVTETMPIFQALLLRGLVTVPALLIIGHFTGGLRLRFSRPQAGIIFWRCLGEAISTVCFLLALTHMPIANLSAIMQSLPLAVTLGAALIFHEPVGWRRATAIGVGFLGVLLIVRPGTEGFDRWSVIGLCAVAAVVLRDLSTRKLPRDVPSVSIAVYGAGSVVLLAGVAMPFTGGMVPVALPQAALLIAASALVLSGYLCAVTAMRVGEVGFVAPFRYTSLLWALVMGWLVFHQFPGALTLTGAAVVMATGIFTLYRERRLVRSTPVPLRVR